MNVDGGNRVSWSIYKFSEMRAKDITLKSFRLKLHIIRTKSRTVPLSSYSVNSTNSYLARQRLSSPAIPTPPHWQRILVNFSRTRLRHYDQGWINTILVKAGYLLAMFAFRALRISPLLLRTSSLILSRKPPSRVKKL